MFGLRSQFFLSLFGFVSTASVFVPSFLVLLSMFVAILPSLNFLSIMCVVFFLILHLCFILSIILLLVFLLLCYFNASILIPCFFISAVSFRSLIFTYYSV